MSQGSPNLLKRHRRYHPFQRQTFDASGRQKLLDIPPLKWSLENARTRSLPAAGSGLPITRVVPPPWRPSAAAPGDGGLSQARGGNPCALMT